MNYLVTYDISNDKQRLHTAKILEDYGERVQESVFELANLNNEIWIECLKRLKNKILLSSEDSVRIYLLCDRCKNEIKMLGKGKKPMDDPDVYII